MYIVIYWGTFTTRCGPIFFIDVSLKIFLLEVIIIMFNIEKQNFKIIVFSIHNFVVHFLTKLCNNMIPIEFCVRNPHVRGYQILSNSCTRVILSPCMKMTITFKIHII